MQERVDERPARVTRARMDNHPRRLVDNHEIVVYEEKLKRQIFRMSNRRRSRQHINLDQFAGRNRMGSLGEAAVDVDASFANQFLDPCPAEGRHTLGQKRIEPPPRVRPLSGESFVCSSTDFSLWILLLISHLGQI